LEVGPLLHVDADLTPFFARGGKLLMYIGWNDGHNPEELIDYYKSVIRTAGDRTRASARLFTIPGMAHCYGGAGCDTFNKLGMIDDWVDHSQAPDRMLASKVTAERSYVRDGCAPIHKLPDIRAPAMSVTRRTSPVPANNQGRRWLPIYLTRRRRRTELRQRRPR